MPASEETTREANRILIDTESRLARLENNRLDTERWRIGIDARFDRLESGQQLLLAAANMAKGGAWVAVKIVGAIIAVAGATYWAVSHLTIQVTSI